jgi:hypothetical protein
MAANHLCDDFRAKTLRGQKAVLPGTLFLILGCYAILSGPKIISALIFGLAQGLQEGG